jgi:hypothetical protein
MTRIAALLLPLAAACTTVGVTDSGSGKKFAPRPAECRVDFFRTKPPETAYDEIATVHWQGTLVGAEGAQEDLRRKACELGADAVVVIRDYVPGTQHSMGVMTGTAIRYRGPRPPESAPASAAPGAGAAASVDGLVPATARESTVLRASPDRAAPVVNRIEAGTAVWASEQATRGFRRVKLAEGRSGYAEEGALEIGKGKPAPIPGMPAAPEGGPEAPKDTI